MDTTPEGKTSLTRNLRSLMATVLFVLLGLAVLPATNAAAYNTVTTGSRPGLVTPYKVQGMHYNACAGQLWTCYNPEVFVPAPYVYRSSATTAAQAITILNQLYRWNGTSWIVYSSQSGSKILPAGFSGTPLLSSDFRIDRAGTYAVITYVKWTNPAGTLNYGQRAIQYVHAGDYTCVGRFTASCTVGAGYLVLRSPGT